MQKLIKLNDQHYIIVDDSEIKVGDWYLTFMNNKIIGEPRKCSDDSYNFSNCKKITHSTQPLEQYYGATDGSLPFVYHKIKQLSLSEVEEAINGYSVEEFAWNNPILSRKDVYDLFHKVFKDRRLDGEFSLSASKQIYQFDTELREISKIKAHQELVKDKLLNTQLYSNNNHLEWIYNRMIEVHGENPNYDYMIVFKKIIQSLLSKTEWDITIDEQGKIKL